MSWDWIKNKFDEGRALLVKEVGRFKNQTFMEATVAGCALVAAADGTVSDAEKEKMLGFIQRSEELKVFETKEVIEFFNTLISNFQFDPAIGEAEALKYVVKIRDNVQASQLLVRVCIAIANSDGNFDESEKTVISAICKELNLNPADFGL